MKSGDIVKLLNNYTLPSLTIGKCYRVMGVRDRYWDEEDGVLIVDDEGDEEIVHKSYCEVVKTNIWKGGDKSVRKKQKAKGRRQDYLKEV